MSINNELNLNEGSINNSSNSLLRDHVGNKTQATAPGSVQNSQTTNRQLQCFRVLIIEDESEIRDFLCQQFLEIGHTVESLPSGDAFMAKIETFNPDLIVMDQMMPVKNGMQLIQELRASDKYSNLPVMMLTGLDSEADKVAALELGADDYVVKPFSFREVVARAQALYRRAQNSRLDKQKVLSFLDVRVDVIAHQVKKSGEEIFLTLTEYRILVALMRAVGAVVSRDNLRQEALGNLAVSDRTIDVHMASLRKKLGDFGSKIDTIRGVGYKLA